MIDLSDIIKGFPSTETPINQHFFEAIVNKVLDLSYPVGKLEMFFDNDDHSSYLGFKWERELVGKMPIGVSASDTDFKTIGKTGGSKELQKHYHKIFQEAYANQKQRISVATNYATSGGSSIYAYAMGNVTDNSSDGNPDTTTAKEVGIVKADWAGTGNAGNMPPYVVIAFWKRVE